MKIIQQILGTKNRKGKEVALDLESDSHACLFVYCAREREPFVQIPRPSIP